MLNIRLWINYLLHRVKANNRHGIHSPFVYKLIDTVIYNFKDQKVYRDIQNIHKNQITDGQLIKPLPLKLLKLLYRLVKYFNPAGIATQSTDAGLQALLGLAVPQAKISNINELSTNTRPDLIMLDAGQLHTFDYLRYAHDNTTLVVTGINTIRHNKQAWQQLKTNNGVRVTIDLFYIGLVFFKPGMSKENFMVKF